MALVSGPTILASNQALRVEALVLVLTSSLPSRYSSSRMRVIDHNWSATKQRLHLQSVAEISCHSVLSGDRIRHVRHRLGLATRTQISVCKLPFPSAGTAVSLFRAKTVRQRPLLPREVETWLLLHHVLSRY